MAWAVGVVTPEEIDKINILNASFLAMHRALDQLTTRPEAVIVDGNRFTPYRDLPYATIVKGDGKYQAIAAASILTKAPADYTAGEILRAIEGSVAPIPCLGSETNECPMSDQCFTLPFWAGLDEVINQYIDSVTLEQLAQSLPAVKEGCGCCGTKS